MNKNLKNILLFALLCVLINEGIKAYFFNVSIKNHKLNKTERNFYKNKKEIDVLIMGNSRSKRILDTIVTQSYNYASPGETNIFTYYKLKEVLENKTITPSYIILPYGFPDIARKKNIGRNNSFFWSKKVDYLELASITNEYDVYLEEYLKSKFIPYYEYPYLRIELSLENPFGHRSKKEFKDISAELREEMAQNTLQRHIDAFFIMDNASLKYLEKTIQLCRDYGKEIIYLNYPVSKNYNNAAAKYMEENNIHWSKVDSIIDANNVFKLDWGKIYQDSVHYFKDDHHLNDKGSYQISVLLQKKLDSLRLEK